MHALPRDAWLASHLTSHEAVPLVSALHMRREWDCNRFILKRPGQTGSAKSRHVLARQELARPALLEAAVRRLLGVYAALEEASGAELTWLAREVLTAAAYHPLAPDQAPLSASGGGLAMPQQERLIAYVAEWYALRILVDTGDLGISFSAPRWAPFCWRGVCLWYGTMDWVDGGTSALQASLSVGVQKPNTVALGNH